jgi:elongation factor P
MATTADFRNGLCLQLRGELYTLVSFQHVKPGKGGAFVRTKLKSLLSGKVIDNTFQAGVKVGIVRVERRACQFLYKVHEVYHFMDSATFDNIVLSTAEISAPQLLREGQEVNLLFHTEENRPIHCELPPFVFLRVQYTEPGCKGDTVTKATKPATLETGAQLQVPLFIQIKDVLKVDTRTHTYVERQKA